jgi:hypothetical protein
MNETAVEVATLLIRRSHASEYTPSATAAGVEIYVEAEGDGRLEIRADSPAAPADEQPARLLFSAGRVGREGGDWLFHVGLWAPSDYREEFLAWYSIEHLPILLECPTWDGCRFVEQPVADGCQFYALHQLADRAALESEQRKASRSTAWFRRLKANDWFDEAFVRTLYRRAR